MKNRAIPFELPEVLVLVPCRDEEAMIPSLCQSLDRLDYPRTKYQVVLIDDGSTDSTRKLIEDLVDGKPGWHLVALPRNVGKASALNAAISQYPFGEFIFVFDADHRPQPDALKQATPYFEDDRVAGVTGRTLPSNSLASLSAYYSTVESYVHQMVTMRAKDRLNLGPALLGSNCGYRRTALEECGGFRAGALLEDSELTLAFYHSGYKIRFAEDAISYHQMPQTVKGYLRQHTRWARGFNDVSRHNTFGLLREKRIPYVLRLELILFSTGYLDRIALTGAGIWLVLLFFNLHFFDFSEWVFYFALITPLLQIIALFVEQGVPRAFWLRLPFMPIYFFIDLYAAAIAMTDSIMNRGQVWTRTERAQTIINTIEE